MVQLFPRLLYIEKKPVIEKGAQKTVAVCRDFGGSFSL